MPLQISHLDLEYPLNSKPRYELERNPHPAILAMLAKNGGRYHSVLGSFSPLSGPLSRIPRLPSAVELSPEDWDAIPAMYARAASGDQEALSWFDPIRTEVAQDISPCWLNGFIPGLDAVALYGFVATNKPKTYVEVGSGNSTKFVRQAISDQRLPTRIISIDPHPRANIDLICDEIIRQPLEECDLSVFAHLGERDVLFVDGSHRCFMNSDTTVFFLDVLPNLAPGVLIGLHDIFLPYDYPEAWAARGYSEQYLLAASLLAGPGRFRIEFPSLYVSLAAELRQVFEQFWHSLPNVVAKRGTSFWFYQNYT